MEINWQFSINAAHDQFSRRYTHMNDDHAIPSMSQYLIYGGFSYASGDILASLLLGGYGLRGPDGSLKISEYCC